MLLTEKWFSFCLLENWRYHYDKDGSTLTLVCGNIRAEFSSMLEKYRFLFFLFLMGRPFTGQQLGFEQKYLSCWIHVHFVLTWEANYDKLTLKLLLNWRQIVADNYYRYQKSTFVSKDCFSNLDAAILNYSLPSYPPLFWPPAWTSWKLTRQWGSWQLRGQCWRQCWVRWGG